MFFRTLIVVGYVLAVLCLFAPGWFKLMFIFPGYMATYLLAWEKRFKAIDALNRFLKEKGLVD